MDMIVGSEYALLVLLIYPKIMSFFLISAYVLPNNVNIITSLCFVY